MRTISIANSNGTANKLTYLLEDDDSDLIFENLDTPSSHISRRHVPHRSNFHHDVDSSHHFEDNDDYWVSRNFRRIKRQLSSIFGLTTELPEVPQQAYEDEDNSINDILLDSHLTRDDLRDDEDIDGHGGSGEEGSGVEVPLGEEGSGVEVPLVSYYRFTITVDELYVKEFTDRNSPDFKRFERSLVEAVEQLYEDIPGRQTANIVHIEQIPNEHLKCKVTMDLSSTEYNNKHVLQQRLLDKINEHHRLGDLIVSPEGFIFSAFDAKHVPACGPEEFPCRDGMCVPYTARCDGRSQCPDNSDEQGCEIPTTEEETWSTTWTSTTTTTTSTIPPTTAAPPPDEWVEPDTETPGVTDQSMRFDLSKQTPEFPVIPQEADTTPAVVTGQIHKHVSHGLVQVTDNQCRADDRIQCFDGIQVICYDQKCDGNRDCDDGSDEEGCSVDYHDCAYDEFSCDVARCIPASQRCDGKQDCDDNTDELRCQEPEHPGK
ncbi:Low-density lipoprotein receptor domain class A [Popillia japonica]|uniref:Low-density lipoprotein receptor domain class A n=1 Tax=Popillia japonica TaxID=7064 RepID=A0AAW1IEH0_POPJA